MTAAINRAPELHEPSRDNSRSIGAILVAQGRLSPAEVEEIQRFASTHGMRFGDASIRLKKLSQQDVDLALAQQFQYPILARGGVGGVSDDLIAGYLPQSESIEPLRALRSQLDLRWPSDKRRVLAITSAARGDGRSWLAANLATVFAQMGRRTLLIDADMRNPRQHVIFNLNNSVGLSALLTGRAGREIVARIHPSLRLFVLPAGSLPPNPQELLGRPAFEVILNLFVEQFDIVILDTPASSEVADAQILASRAGTALVLAHLNHSRKSELAAAMLNLSQTDVSVIGSVTNDH